MGAMDGLTVVESVPADPAECANGGSIPYPPAYEQATEPWVAWRLRDAAGEVWLAQFAAGSVPDDLLAPDDIVSVRYLWGTATDERGFLGLERDGSDGRPTIFVSYGWVTPSITIEPGPAVCDMDGCTVNMTRATVDGVTKDLELDERADMGALVLQNDWFRDLRCQVGHPAQITSLFLVGAVTPR